MKLKETSKDALKGIVMALIAAWFFPAIYLSLASNIGDLTRDLKGTLLFLFIAAPVVGFITTFWLVIPFGAALGILIPKITRQRPRKTVIVYSFLIGLLTGGAAGFIFSAAGMLPGFRDGRWSEFLFVLPVISIYSAVWISAYSYWCSKEPLKLSETGEFIQVGRL